MSKVSNIYDLFEAAISTILTGKTEIPNPFDIESNNDNFLKDGYGFIYGAATGDSETYPSFEYYTRPIVLVTTKVIYKNRSDVDVYGTVQKQMIEDQNTIITTLAKDRTFDDDLTSLEFSGDNGVEFIFGDKFNFLKLESTFDLKYREDKYYRYP